MRIEELTQEQIEKVKALETDEERLDYLKECGVELDDDMLAEVAGGARLGGGRPSEGKDDENLKCQTGPNKGKPHKYVKTGKKRKGHFIGLIDDREYKCIYCGRTVWRDF